MKIPFHKYQGTGNDFVLIDQRETKWISSEDNDLVHLICDRKFGIGADGLILLQNKDGYDFEMIYFNADGHLSSMCGNGGRCIVAFAKHLGIIDKNCRFLAVDGPHEAIAEEDQVALKMSDVNKVETGSDFFILDTGSPHYVVYVEDLDDINVPETGRLIRYDTPYAKVGINVNFVEDAKDELLVGTYERGVEDETLSCGTGVTAAALATAIKNNLSGTQTHKIKSKGGDLEVSFERKGEASFGDIWLKGPAVLVFEGSFVHG